MVALGQQANNLVAQAGQCLSFWKNKYSLTCNSCTNSVEHQFSGQTGFNRWLTANLVRQGDLIKSVTFVAILPGLAPCGEDTWAHWVNNIAYTIAQEVQWDIGGTLASRSYGDALRIQEELTSPSALKSTKEMTGTASARNTLIDWAQYVQKLYYLRLSSWVDWNSGNALPICAMMQQTVTIKIQTCPMQVAFVSGPQGATPLVITTVKGSYAQMNDQTLDGFLYVDWVTLDERERDTFVDTPLTYLMYQVQRQQTCLTCQSSLLLQRVEMNFNHPVFLLAWYLVQTDAVMRKDIWNWSGNSGVDAATSFQLKSNSDEIMSERDATYFRTLHNSLVGLNVPSIYVYIWSFAVFPFRFQPSGFLNMSRVDGMALFLRLQPQLREVLVTILAWNYNWFNVDQMYGTPEYSGC